MKLPVDCFCTLAFFATVAYGIRPDHPAIATSVDRLSQFVAAGIALDKPNTTDAAMAAKALDSAAAHGDSPVVRLLLRLGAGTHPDPLMRPAITAYRAALRNGHADTAKEIVATGLVPDWA